MSVSEVFLSYLSGPFSSPFIRGPFSHAAASVFNVDALNKFKFYVCVFFVVCLFCFVFNADYATELFKNMSLTVVVLT